MNIRLSLLQLYFPGFIKKRRLARLFDLTAAAFGCQPPPIRGMSFEQALREYALFTSEQTGKYLNNSSDIDRIKEKLFKGSYDLGRDLRRQFKIKASRDVLMMLKMVYRLLGIDLQGDSGNQVIIKSCFFSRYYSPPVCQVVSALDQGLAAGLSSGGRLNFYQRITEGSDCCRAYFILEEV